MTERAFVIMQVGTAESPERKRADEIYHFVIAPAVTNAGLEPYRADLDISPGAITPKMLSELLNAKVVIADLTGRNPNVFYELGITHSYARPLISIADSVKSLPFDAKDERVIEIGEYLPTGLSYAQGEQAKTSLQESLRIVLSAEYTPPSPLREVAANRSVDQLAPENPLAAEMAQMRETLEEVRKNIVPRTFIPASFKHDIAVLRNVLMEAVADLGPWDLDALSDEKTSNEQKSWAKQLREKWESSRPSNTLKFSKENNDPWESDASNSGYSDEPPF